MGMTLVDLEWWWNMPWADRVRLLLLLMAVCGFVMGWIVGRALK